MNILLDTNILLNIVRATDVGGVIRLINPNDSLLYMSIVSEAEIRTIAIRKQWGLNRLGILEDFLKRVQIIDVNRSTLNIYTLIDTYSQRANPDFGSFPFDTPRNMGKNDLWIASLASFLGLKLVTTDADFDHLHNIFFEVRKINPTEFIPFF